MTARLWIFSLCVLTLLTCALSTGAAIYYLLLFALVMMLALGALSCVVALWTLKIQMQAPRRKIERGGTAPLLVTVRYVSFLPVRSVQLTLSVPEDERAHETREITLAPFVPKQFEYQLPCPHRGVFHVGVHSMRVTDVFQLFSLSRKLPQLQSPVEVRPRVHQLPTMELKSLGSEAAFLSRATEDTASPSDVRNYRDGDQLKKIHWKLSMRKRELLVRNYEESTRPDTLILPDLSPMGYMRSQSLVLMDAICETAASIARAQLQAGYPVRMPLMSADPTEPSGQDELAFPRFVDALMRVKFDSPYPYEQVLALEMRRMQRTGGAVLITARLTPRTCDTAEQLRRSGMQVSVCFVTESRRSESLEMLERLRLMGIQAHRIDPWEKGLNEESLLGQVTYG